MHTQHRDDPDSKFPQLAVITEDNKDVVIEVNRSEEIDEFLSSVKTYLASHRKVIEDIY
jgi:hypothetical protein